VKASCLQENLSRGLGIVGRAVATRSTLPVTSHVLVATDGGRLRLAATNLEIAITVWVGAKVDSEGAVAVPAQVLTQFVNSLPPDRIDLSVSGRVLQVKCARFEARINGLDPEDFPPIPTVAETPTTAMDPETLRGVIEQVAFAAATDDTRPVLTGVYTRLAGDQGLFAAADGFRLSVRQAPLLSPVAEGQEVEVIVPARALLELERIIPDGEQPVQIAIQPNRAQLLFRIESDSPGVGTIELVSQLIQGNFPNFQQLIPKTYTCRVVVNTQEFLKATRVAEIFARHNNDIVRLNIFPGEELTPGRLRVSARAEDTGENVGEIDAVVDGEEAKIAFNVRYLKQALEVVDTPQVALEMTSPSAPGVVRPVDQDSFIHLIMPMFVTW